MEKRDIDIPLILCNRLLSVPLSPIIWPGHIMHGASDGNLQEWSVGRKKCVKRTGSGKVRAGGREKERKIK